MSIHEMYYSIILEHEDNYSNSIHLHYDQPYSFALQGFNSNSVLNVALGDENVDDGFVYPPGNHINVAFGSSIICGSLDTVLRLSQYTLQDMLSPPPA